MVATEKINQDYDAGKRNISVSSAQMYETELHKFMSTGQLLMRSLQYLLENYHRKLNIRLKLILQLLLTNRRSLKIWLASTSCSIHFELKCILLFSKTSFLVLSLAKLCLGKLGAVLYILAKVVRLSYKDDDSEQSVIPKPVLLRQLTGEKNRKDLTSWSDSNLE